MCCTNQNNTNSAWEPESIAVFKAMDEGRFPLNTHIKNAFDQIVKLSKGTAQKPGNVKLTADAGTTISDESLRHRIVSLVIIDDVVKSTGFTKTGDDEAEQLASNTLALTDDTEFADGATVVIVFQ